MRPAIAIASVVILAACSEDRLGNSITRRPDATASADASIDPDAAPDPDATATITDASGIDDDGPVDTGVRDTGEAPDTGEAHDTGEPTDTGVEPDSGVLADTGIAGDTGVVTPDAGTPMGCPPAMPIDIPVRTGAGYISLPRFVWTGTRYAAVWYDNRGGMSFEVLFAWVDVAGSLDPTTVRVVSPDDGFSNQFARAAWSGTELGVVYSDDRATTSARAVYFKRVDATGEPIAGSERLVSTIPGGQDSPAIAWNPIDETWGIAWTNLSASSFVLFDAAGEKITGSEVSLGGTLSDTGEPILWNGSAFAVVTAPPVNIYELDGSGASTMPLNTIAVEPGSASPLRATLATSGPDYLVVWMTRPNMTHEIVSGRANVGGGYVMGSSWQLSNPGVEAGEPTVAFDGSKFSVVYTVQSGVDQNLNTLDLSLLGAPLNSNHPIANTSNREWWPSLVWNGCQKAIVYHYDVGSDSDIHAILAP